MAGKSAKARKITRRSKAQTEARTKARGSRHKRAARGAKRWSQRVTRESNALDLKQGVFTLASPHAIALSLKRSALASRRRKTNPYRSALSMLTFLREPGWRRSFRYAPPQARSGQKRVAGRFR
jgi:hypothetical protein